MAIKLKPLGKNPFVGKSISVKLPRVQLPKINRVPRGRTVRWDIDYGKLFKNRGKR